MSAANIHIPDDLRDSVPPRLLNDFVTLVDDVINIGKSLGVVITVETQPLQPLAMGNYTLRCELRKGRVLA